MPDPSTKEVYDKLYDAFLSTYDQLIPVFDKLSDCRIAIDAYRKNHDKPVTES